MFLGDFLEGYILRLGQFCHSPLNLWLGWSVVCSVACYILCKVQTRCLWTPQSASRCWAQAHYWHRELQKQAVQTCVLPAELAARSWRREDKHARTAWCGRSFWGEARGPRHVPVWAPLLWWGGKRNGWRDEHLAVIHETWLNCFIFKS